MTNLKWFYERFHEIVKSKKIPVKNFAEKAHVNYARLLKILKGSKLINEWELRAVLSHEVFTDEERQELLHLHRIFSVGVEERINVEYMERLLNSFYDTIVEKDALAFQSKENPVTQQVADVCQMIDAEIMKSYYNKLKQCLLGRKDRVFRARFYLPSLEPVLHEVYHTLDAIKSCLNTQMSFEIVFYCSINQADLIGHLEQVLQISKYIKLVTLDEQITLQCLTEQPEAENGFSHFICFEDRKILLNDRATEGIVVLGEQEQAIKKSASLTNFAYTEQLEIKTLNDYLQNHKRMFTGEEMIHQSLRYSFSSLSFSPDLYKKGLLERIGVVAVKDEVLNGFFQRIENIDQRIREHEDIKQFVCAKGVETFLHNGILNDYAGIIGTFTAEERLMIVYSTLQKMQQGFQFRLIRPESATVHPFLGVIRFFEFSLDNNELLVVRHIRQRDLKMAMHGDLNLEGKSIEYVLKIKDPFVIKAWRLFTDTMLQFIAESTQWSFNYLKSCANQYFRTDSSREVQSWLKKINSLEMQITIKEHIN